MKWRLEFRSSAPIWVRDQLREFRVLCDAVTEAYQVRYLSELYDDLPHMRGTRVGALVEEMSLATPWPDRISIVPFAPWVGHEPGWTWAPQPGDSGE